MVKSRVIAVIVSYFIFCHHNHRHTINRNKCSDTIFDYDLKKVNKL